MAHIHDRKSYEELRDAVLWWESVFKRVGRFIKTKIFRRTGEIDLEEQIDQIEIGDSDDGSRNILSRGSGEDSE